MCNMYVHVKVRFSIHIDVNTHKGIYRWMDMYTPTCLLFDTNAFTCTGINAHELMWNVKTQRHKCLFTFFMKCADIVHFVFAPRTLNISNFNKRRRPIFHFVSFSSLVFCRIFFKIQFQFVWEIRVTPKISTANIELDHCSFYESSIFC